MKGLIGKIEGSLGKGQIQKYIVSQSSDAWTYYAWNCYIDPKTKEYIPLHQKIAQWNGLPDNIPGRRFTRPDGVVEEITFLYGNKLFEGVIGGGYARLQKKKGGLVLLLYDHSLSYGPINNEIFEALKNPILEAYKKENLRIEEVVFSCKLSKKKN